MLKLQQLADILELQALCEKEDHIMLKLNWDMLKNRAPGSVEDFFHYEGKLLIGFLGIYRMGQNIEVCGMTHPLYRRRGVFTKLWEHAVSRGQLVDAHQVLLNVPRDSVAGQAWVHTRPVVLQSIEYTLKLDTEHHPLRLEEPESAVLRPFNDSDIPLWIRLDADAFAISEASTTATLANANRSKTRKMLVIEHAGIAVGKIEVDYEGEHSWIYGFVIDPALRGHGIGRSALRQVALTENQAGHSVWLNVVSDNDRALYLYESCGFQHQDIQDYYLYSPPMPEI